MRKMITAVAAALLAATMLLLGTGTANACSNYCSACDCSV
jgi:hypothetical protein